MLQKQRFYVTGLIKVYIGQKKIKMFLDNNCVRVYIREENGCISDKCFCRMNNSQAGKLIILISCNPNLFNKRKVFYDYKAQKSSETSVWERQLNI